MRGYYPHSAAPFRTCERLLRQANEAERPKTDSRVAVPAVFVVQEHDVTACPRDVLQVLPRDIEDDRRGLAAPRRDRGATVAERVLQRGLSPGDLRVLGPVHEQVRKFRSLVERCRLRAGVL